MYAAVIRSHEIRGIGMICARPCGRMTFSVDKSIAQNAVVKKCA